LKRFISSAIPTMTKTITNIKKSTRSIALKIDHTTANTIPASIAIIKITKTAFHINYHSLCYYVMAVSAAFPPARYATANDVRLL